MSWESKPIPKLFHLAGETMFLFHPLNGISSCFLEPWSALSCLTHSLSVQLVRLPLARVCRQHTGGIVLKNCIVCLGNFTWHPCNLLFYSAQTVQRSGVAAVFLSGSCCSCPALKYHPFPAQYLFSQSVTLPWCSFIIYPWVCKKLLQLLIFTSIFLCF